MKQMQNMQNNQINGKKSIPRGRGREGGRKGRKMRGKGGRNGERERRKREEEEEGGGQGEEEERRGEDTKKVARVLYKKSNPKCLCASHRDRQTPCARAQRYQEGTVALDT